MIPADKKLPLDMDVANKVYNDVIGKVTDVLDAYTGRCHEHRAAAMYGAMNAVTYVSKSLLDAIRELVAEVRELEAKQPEWRKNAN